MLASEFMSTFAKMSGFDLSLVRTADRALANAGMRQKAQGRAIPHVTRTEAVRLMLVMCGSSQIGKADKLVRNYEKNFECYGADAGKGEPGNEFYRRGVGFSFDRAKKLSLLEAVEILCGNLAENELKGWYVGLEIEVNGPVSIQVDDWDGTAGELLFSGVMDTSNTRIATKRVVPTDVLRWIGKTTVTAE